MYIFFYLHLTLVLGSINILLSVFDITRQMLAASWGEPKAAQNSHAVFNNVSVMEALKLEVHMIDQC